MTLLAGLTTQRDRDDRGFWRRPARQRNSGALAVAFSWRRARTRSVWAGLPAVTSLPFQSA